MGERLRNQSYEHMVRTVPEDDERIISVKRPQDYIVCGRFIQSSSAGRIVSKFENLEAG